MGCQGSKEENMQYMNNIKWQMFFTTLNMGWHEIVSVNEEQVYELVCKNVRDPCIRKDHIRIPHDIAENGIRNPGFGGPCYFWQIEWILIPRVLTRYRLTGEYKDDGHTERLFNYLQRKAHLPLELAKEGIFFHVHVKGTDS